MRRKEGALSSQTLCLTVWHVGMSSTPASSSAALAAVGGGISLPLKVAPLDLHQPVPTVNLA